LYHLLESCNNVPCGVIFFCSKPESVQVSLSLQFLFIHNISLTSTLYQWYIEYLNTLADCGRSRILATRNRDNRWNIRYSIYLCALALTAIFLSQTLTGCADSSPQTKQAPAQKKSVYGPVALTPSLAPSALHGPTNFLLHTPFDYSSASGTATDDNGDNTAIDANTIKTGINSELPHLLFEVSRNDAVNVYLPGSATPIQAQVSQRSDGSTAIDYTHTASSINIAFAAALYKNQIIVKYEQQYTPLITENASATDVQVTFTTSVQWVAADLIPAAPDNGQYQITKNGAISLTWDAGHNAVAYHVYRILPAQDQQFQLLGTVKNTIYNDKSAQNPKKLLTMGIAYAIFSVGPTGIENPTDTVISLSAP
jgi:hypothetical protein